MYASDEERREYCVYVNQPHSIGCTLDGFYVLLPLYEFLPIFLRCALLLDGPFENDTKASVSCASESFLCYPLSENIRKTDGNVFRAPFTLDLGICFRLRFSWVFHFFCLKNLLDSRQLKLCNV